MNNAMKSQLLKDQKNLVLIQKDIDRMLTIIPEIKNMFRVQELELKAAMQQAKEATENASNGSTYPTTSAAAPPVQSQMQWNMVTEDEYENVNNQELCLDNILSSLVNEYDDD